MKRAIRPVTAVFFILMLLIISLVPLALAQSSNIPHEDPHTTEDTFKAYSIFDGYSVIVDLIGNGSFKDVDKVLKEMTTIQLPADIRDVVDAYYALISEVYGEMNKIDVTLVAVAGLIMKDFWAEAGDKLDDADNSLGNVESKIDDIRVATEDLKGQLSRFILNSTYFNDVYDKYTALIERVELLRVTYANLRQDLDAAIELAGLDTIITLNIFPQTVQVGEQLTLSGRLTDADGIPLPDREVGLELIGLSSPVKVQTDTAGYYTAVIRETYKYTSTIVAKAAYTPATSDRNKYKATYLRVIVPVSFNVTQLELVDVPQQLLIGFPNIISGFVEGDGVWLSGRTVQLWFGRDLVDEGLTDEEGHFELPLIPPAGYDLGNHTLGVTVLFDNSKKCSGAFESADVQIYRAFPEVTIDTARYIVLSSSMAVSGEVTYEGEPVVDADVIVKFVGTQTSTMTNDSGQYSVVVSLPSSSIAMGSQEVSVSVIPDDAWLGSVIVQSEVLAFSLLNVSFLSAAIVAVGIVVYRSRKRLTLELLEAKAPLDLAPETDLQGSSTFSGNKVLDLYHEAVLIVGQLTGTPFRANATLREYLMQLNFKQDGVKDVFTRFTHLAEMVFYSGAPPMDSFDDAQKLFNKLRQELISEPA